MLLIFVVLCIGIRLTYNIVWICMNNNMFVFLLTGTHNDRKYCILV